MQIKMDQLEKARQLYATNDEFNEELDQQVKALKKFVESSDATGCIPQIMVLGEKEKDKKRPLGIMMLAEIPDDKRTAFYQLGEKLAKSDKIHPIMVFLITEAWVRTFSKKEDIPKDGRIAGYGDKQEVVVVSGMTIDGRFNMATISVKRDKGDHMFLGKVTLLKYSPKEKFGEAPLLEAFHQGWRHEFLRRMNER